MQLYFCSDLHIESEDDPVLSQLNALLKQVAENGDRVILAGDIFDLFVGKKKVFLKRFESFFSALEVAGKRGVQIDYLEGNHDFQLKGVFKAYPFVSLYSESLIIEAKGKRFYVAHGDLANSSDYGYRFLRAFFRSLLMKTFIRLAPDDWIDKIGQKSSCRSRQSRVAAKQENLVEIRKVYRSFAADKVLEGFDFVILGHCHDLDSMKFKVGERQGVYMNIGFPKSHGSIVTWSDEDHELTRMPLPTLSSDITRDSNFSSTSESNSPKAKTADWKSKSTLSY